MALVFALGWAILWPDILSHEIEGGGHTQRCRFPYTGGFGDQAGEQCRLTPLSLRVAVLALIRFPIPAERFS